MGESGNNGWIWAVKLLYFCMYIFIFGFIFYYIGDDLSICLLNNYRNWLMKVTTPLTDNDTLSNSYHVNFFPP